MIPEGWTKSVIGNHIDLLSGFPFKSKQYVPEGVDTVRLLRGDNIGQGYIRWRNARHWPRQSTSGLEAYTLALGDLVIAMDRTWVSNGLKIAEIRQNDIPSLLVQRVSRLRALPSFQQTLLKQIFSGHRFEQYVKSVQTETAVPHISAKQIKEFPVLVPPHDEQVKIAKILSTWDTAIETVEKLIENSRARRKFLMRKLLTRDNYSVRATRKWRKSILSNHCDITTGTKDLKDRVAGGKYPFFVRSANIESINSYSFDGEAILVPGDGRVGEIFHYINGKFDFHQRVYKLSEFDDATGRFIYYYLQQFFKRQVRRHTAKATVDSLRMPVFTTMPIELPPLDEQERITAILDAADNSLDALLCLKEKLTTEKQALMQQLLAGKRRVKPDPSNKNAIA